jgi:AbrB family looped-hinge helix DNA binding protein
MHEVKLSRKNQIVISRDIRDALGVKAGDSLLVVPRGNMAIILRKPRRYSKAIAGTGKDLYGSNYLMEERESWQSAASR